ncbi:MAG: serine hydrolase [Pedosphaera sp.]|nr:serine hydrolase [Pedosphaera sp.]
MNRTTLMLVPVILLCLFAQRLRAADGPPTAAEIKGILQERIDTAKKGLGIVVGILDEKGPRIIAYGKTAREQGKDVDGETVFEIGSISKVFTSLLLADMVGRGEVKLGDPISKFLPASVKVPAHNGRDITLVDLATHTSGLPRLPDNLSPRDGKNPYADYTVEQLYEFLGSYTLPRDIGAQYEYSNLGGGLLGHLLALKAGTNYEALVLQRICLPLGMTDTRITLSPDQRARLATGHDTQGRPVPNWDLPTLAGAGALRSTANDLLKFAAANMGKDKSPLQPAMELAQTPRHDAGSSVMKIGLGWHIAYRYGTELVWHNGGTGGYRSFCGFDKKKQRAIVVLANSENSIDDIGFHLLEAKYELEKSKPGDNHVAIKLDPKIMDGYVGRYQFAPSMFFNVRRDGDHLQGQLTGQSYLDLFPKTQTEFFNEAVKAQITFQDATNGKPASLVLHQGGIDQTAEKISDEIQKEKERVAIHLDPKLFDAYAGQYELAPGAIFTLRRQGDRLMAQLTGQGFFEIYPESETEFFYKVVDAQLSFEKNTRGETTALILHQNGADQKAKKVK